MIKSTLKKNRWALFLAGISGMIIISLMGCTTYIYVTQPVAEEEVLPSSTASPFQPLEVTSLQIVQSSPSANGLDLNIEAKIKNHNPFSVDIKNSFVSIRGITGFQYGQSTAPDNKIEMVATQAINFRAVLPATAFKEQKLIAKIDTNAEYAGSVLPVKSTATFDMREMLAEIDVKPAIYLQADAMKISWNGTKPLLEARVQGTIKNPYPFDIMANTITFTVQDSLGKPITSDLIKDDIVVAPHSNSPFAKSIILPFQTLNERTIIVVADITASVLYSMSSLKVNTIMNKHTLADLIEVPQLVIDTKSNWFQTYNYLTLVLTVKNSLTNHNPYDLTAGEMAIQVYKPVNSLAISAVQTGFLSGIPAVDTKTMTNQISLHPNAVSDIGGEAVITVSIPLGIEGLNETVPVSARTKFTVIP